MQQYMEVAQLFFKVQIVQKYEIFVLTHSLKIFPFFLLALLFSILSWSICIQEHNTRLDMDRDKMRAFDWLVGRFIYEVIRLHAAHQHEKCDIRGPYHEGVFFSMVIGSGSNNLPLTRKASMVEATLVVLPVSTGLGEHHWIISRSRGLVIPSPELRNSHPMRVLQNPTWESVYSISRSQRPLQICMPWVPLDIILFMIRWQVKIHLICHSTQPCLS